MEIRRLTSDDIFLVMPIISAFGIEDFKKCFNSPEVIKALRNTNGDEKNKEKVGLTIAFDVAATIVRNLPKCKDDVYTFLASVTTTDNETISQLSPAKFMQLIIDVMKQEDISDFLKVVSTLFE